MSSPITEIERLQIRYTKFCTLGSLHFYVDKTNAPAGFIPIPKASLPDNQLSQNICRACDWRSECNGAVCSCMADKRPDGIGVVFKKKGSTWH